MVFINKNNLIRINISGKIFELFEYKLNNYPLSLLGNTNERSKYFDKSRNEYFFDRNREAFEGIFNFYQTDGLLFKAPTFVAIDVFYQEIQFFKLDSYLNSTRFEDSLLVFDLKCKINDIKSNNFNYTSSQLKLNKEIIKNNYKKLSYFYENDEDLGIYDEELIPSNKYQKYLWYLLERPNSSLCAKIWSLFNFLVVILSICVMCFETVVDSSLENSTEQLNNEYNINENYLYINNNNTIKTERKLLFFVLELICNFIFTIELIFRLIASKNKIRFLKKIFNLVDLFSIIPFWLILILNNKYFLTSKIILKINNINNNSYNVKRQNNQYFLSILKILKLIKILRIFKLSRHVQLINIMGKILYECLNEILLLISFLLINIVIFSSLIYYIELFALEEKTPFISNLKYLLLNYSNNNVFQTKVFLIRFGGL